MKKQILLALMALISLESLQAADPSLTDTTAFVLGSGIRSAIATAKELEDDIVTILSVITAIVFVRHCCFEYLDHKYLEAQIERKRQQEQRQELEQLKQLEEQLIRYNERRDDLKNQIEQREQSIKNINALLANRNMPESQRDFISTSLETAQSDLQYWHNELAKLTGNQ